MAAPAWPHFGMVPPMTVAQEVARLLREAACRRGSDARLPITELLRLARVTHQHADLGAADGGREALLLPVADDSFQLVVDPTPRGGWPDHGRRMLSRTSRARVRFRIAHEIAHTFFYTRMAGRRPQRTTSPGSRSEERWCDAFAEALLLPQSAVAAAPATGHAVFALADTFGVSAEVSARAFARHHPARPRVALLYWRSSEECFEPSRAALQWSSTSQPDLADEFSRPGAALHLDRRQVTIVDVTETY